MLEEYIVKNNKKMRMGYTTGSCSAAAAKAAAAMLLGEQIVREVFLMTPKGIGLTLPVEEISMESGSVRCAVRKDGGDDPDVTNGILVFAEVSYGAADQEDPVLIDGGFGVGRVTLAGLEQPIGAAAINHVPREMIRREVEAQGSRFGCSRPLSVVISVPQGQKIAKKTFNPRLGIVGGISILGTSGIVEPMSEDALIRSIEVEVKVHISNGEETLVVIPGNYGSAFSSNELGIDAERYMKCSNYVGETLDFAVNHGAKAVLLIGHIGKFIKLAGGIMNTHSRNADARMELLAAAAVRAGVPYESVREILAAPTTDEGLRILAEGGHLEPVMEQVMEKIAFYLQHRCGGAIHTEAMTFSNVYGLIGKTKGADALLEKVKEKQENK